MYTDYYLIIGIVLLALAIPSLVGAYSESRVPRVAAIMVMISGSLIVLAITQKPSGYSFAEIPDVFMRVIGQITR